MAEFISTVFSFVIVLGLIVLVHELGHYFAARLVGVKVETFSIGFGKRLLGLKIGDTDFRLSAIPLGGFVKMSGEDAEDGGDYKSWDFQSKNRGQKIFVLASGALMNILLTVVIFTIIYMTGVRVHKYTLEKPVLGYIEVDSPASVAGLQVGDLIKTVNRKPVDNWGDLELLIATSAEDTLEIGYLRDGEDLNTNLKVDARSEYHMGYAGIYCPLNAVIDTVVEGEAAEKYGIKRGDKILAVDGKKISGYFLFRDAVAANPGKKSVFTVERGDEVKEIEVLIGEREGRGFIGILPVYEISEKSYRFFGAVSKSFTEIVKLGGLIFKSFKKMIVGKLSPKTLSGPIEIARVSNRAMKSGMASFFTLIAFISLQLGIVNLFPIPALDGGHLMIYTIEAIIRKEFSVKMKTVLINMGFLILLTLMGFVILNDVAKTLPDGWGSFWPF